MQRRANPILTFSLCTALIVHLLGLSAMAWWYVSTHPGPYLPPLDKRRILADLPAMAHHANPRRPLPVPKQVPPPPKPKPQAARPLPKPDSTHPPLKDDSGEETAHGTANRSTDGPRPMEALRGLEQADLMRATTEDKLLIDPGALNPAAAGAPDGSSDPRMVASTPGIRQPELEPQTLSGSIAAVDPNRVATEINPGRGPQPPRDPVKSGAADNRTAAATGSANPNPAAKPAVTNDSKAPPKAVKGHLATAGDTDSVALKPDADFQFKAGKLEARKGLKVKFTQPRLGLGSEIDLQALGKCELVMQVEVDASGKVINADVATSSGSGSVDQDFRICMYSCEFAPEKDKNGRPKPSTIWTIHILL